MRERRERFLAWLLTVINCSHMLLTDKKASVFLTQAAAGACTHTQTHTQLGPLSQSKFSFFGLTLSLFAFKKKKKKEEEELEEVVTLLNLDNQSVRVPVEPTFACVF